MNSTKMAQLKHLGASIPGQSLGHGEEGPEQDKSKHCRRLFYLKKFCYVDEDDTFIFEN